MEPAGLASADWWRPAPPAAAVPDRDTTGSRVAYGAFVAFTFVLLVAPQNMFPVLASLRIAFLTAGLAIAAHVWDRWSRGLPLARPGRETRLAAALLAWAVLTLPLSLWPGGSLSILVDLYGKALAVFWLIGNVVDTLPRLRVLGWTLTLLTAWLAMVAMSNYASGVFGPERDRRLIGYDAGLTKNPNDLALMINLIVPITAALLLSSKRPLARGILASALVLQVIAVVLTFSRAGFLTLGAILGLYAWRLLWRPGRGLVFVALLLACLGLPFLPAGYVDRLLTVTDINSDPTGSAQARLGGTLSAIDYVASHPILGAGLGMNIMVVNGEMNARSKQVHNTYLEYGVDLGVPGLVMFALLHFGSWKGARQTRRLVGSGVGELAEGIELSLVAFAVAAFFHPAAYHFYFYYIAGLAVAVRAVGERVAAEVA